MEEKSERGPMDGKRGESKGEKLPRGNDSNRRVHHFINFTSERLTLGFSHLPVALQPASNESRHANSLYIDKVNGWRIPKHVYDQAVKGKFNVGIHLSLSLFHLSSGSFFGSTWMSPRIEIDDLDRSFTRDIDIPIQEIVYIMSKVLDQTCVGVIEVIAGLYNRSFTISSSQYGCGWTMLTSLFSKQPPPDLADGPDKIKLMSCPMYAGSPRQLVLTKDLQVLLSRLKEINGCSLFFKLYSHRRLLTMQHLIKENEVIGRYDSVAGLKAREVIPPLETTPRFICCVGDDEALNPRDGVQILPARPMLALASFIEIIDCQLFVPRRDAMEIRLIDAMASSFPADKRSELKILSRSLRYGLHNGHTTVAPFVSVQLAEDPMDREILSTDPVNKLRLDGYVPDSNMAVTLLVEYLVGVETVKNDRQDPRDLLQSSQSGAIKPLTASVCLGCGIYLPSDGQVLYLRNVKPTSSQEDGLNIELSLMQDAAAVSLLSTIPLVSFTTVGGGANNNQASTDRSNVGASFVAQEKKFRVSASLDFKAAKNVDRDDDKGKTGSAAAVEQSQPVMELGATFGFDIRIVHPVQGELKHEQDISSLKQLSFDGGAKAGIASGVAVGDHRDDGKTERDDSSRRFPRDEKGVFDDDDDQAAGRRHSRRAPVAKPAKVATSRERLPTGSRFARSDRDDYYDDEQSDGEDEGGGYVGRGVQESIVGGDNKHNRLMIDPFFYNLQQQSHGKQQTGTSSQRGGRNDDQESEGSREDFFPKTKEIQLRSNLAAAIMNSRFVPRRADLASAPAYSYGQPGHHQSMVAAAGPSAFTGDPASAFNQVHRAKNTMVPAMGNDFFMRGLSRGAKSRLHRYGIQDTIEDSPYAAVNANANNLIHNQQPVTTMAVDLELEAGDDLSLHEINIQFGGFRMSGKDGSKGFMPRAIYFSFQFFTCEATRTEDLRLILADGDREKGDKQDGGGPMAVLVRDLDEQRQEPGLVLRYLVDCSRSSPFEAIEFAEYLAHRSLYIDVWDADSLLPIGTIGIPLRLLMRQNKPMVKHALECDVINCEVAAPSYGGVTAMTVMEGGPIVGELLGAVQLVIANYGSKGHGSSHPQARPTMPIEGLNWRAHSSDINGGGHHRSAIMTPIRPKNSVRAKPLSSAAPELSRALEDVRHHSGHGGQPFRSLGSGRDGPGHGSGGVSTLNYDEVVTIFKQFAGAKKGTVQYAGKLMTLMNLPSMAVLTKKMTKILKMHSNPLAFKAAILRYANSSEDLTAANLEEFLADVSKRTKIEIKEEERRLFAAKLLKDSHLSEETSRTIPAADVVKLITEEADRQDWATVRKRLFQCAQKAEMEGHDVEQMLSDHDPDGNHRISAFKLRDFLQQLSSFGKLTASDIQLTIRMFSRHKDSEDVNVNEPIALPEFLAAIGRTYVGNLQARVKKLMQSQAAESGPLEAKYVIRLLNDGKENSGAINTVTGGVKYSYDLVEGTLRSLGVYSDLSAAQVRSILHKLDPKGTGAIAASSLLNYLGISYNKADLPSSAGAAAAAHDSDGRSGSSGNMAGQQQQQQVMTAEDLLRLLIDKAQAHGLQVDAIFRHFDANGDGSIGGKELEQGLDQLELFNGIPNWKQQLPAIIKRFDSPGDGLVSLKEFFKFLGIKEDYAPNIIQRLTKIFAIATDKGLSFKAIFEELDSDKNHTLDANELMSGLQKMGSFEGVSHEDVAAVIKIFDSDNSGVVSLHEFVSFFTQRVEEDKNIRRDKNGHKIAHRFREVMRAAQGKGASVADIFRHLDKDGGGSVSTAELGVSLSKLPHLKALKKEEIDILLAAIDSDGSGDVTLDEFEAFVNQGQEVSPHPSTAEQGQSMDMVQLVKETFGAAIAKGLKIEEEFRLLDRDRSGRISLKEFEQIIRQMPSFKSCPIAEIKRVFNVIDVDSSGLISPEEFKRFVTEGRKEYEADVSSRRADGEESKASKQRGGPMVEERSEERFIRKITAIAAGVEGSLSQFLAYLDDDGDGLILPARLLGTLRREGMFDRDREALYVSEEEVMTILDPFMIRAKVDRGDNREEIRDMIKVIPLLQYLESRHLPKRLIELDYDTKEGDDDHNIADSYHYSADPAVNAVEKKLNYFGRLLARKGVDVEQLFLEHDPSHSGHVMRTDFVKVLGSLGMYLLEEGKVLREGNTGHNGSNQANEMRRLQLQQVRRVASQGHGSHTGYSSQAPNLARKMFRQQGHDTVGGAGEFKSHLESMVIIDWYRQGQKQALLQQVLSHSLAHTVHLFTRFGSTLFFEYPLTNPFSHEERFEVELPVDAISGQELRLVTSYDEWTMLRRTVRPCVGSLGPHPAEMDMFDLLPDSDSNRGRGRGRVIGVTLLPHETVFMPFTFLSLQPFKHRNQHAAAAATAKATAKATGGSNTRGQGGGGEGKHDRDGDDDYRSSRRTESKADDYLEAEEKGNDSDNNIQAGAIDRMVDTIAVRVLSCSHGHVISILRVVIHPRPFVIHRVIRCYEFEHAVAKRHVKLVGNRHSYEYSDGHHGEQRFFVHCVETYNDHDNHSNSQQSSSSRVAVEWGDRLMSAHPELQQSQDNDSSGGGAMTIVEMLLRYRCGPAPSSGSFFLLLYRDPYQSKLHEVWQVMVHSRTRLDIHGTVGGTAAGDLVIRGDNRHPRRVRAFGLPAPALLQLGFKPANVFQLVPGAFNRVVIAVRAKSSLSVPRRLLINVVDVDSKELIAAHLLSVQAAAPAVARAYEVEVTVGETVFKKILFRNPWASIRKFKLLSSNEDIMKPRSDSVELGPGGSAYLRLQFNGWQSGETGVREVLLFLVDAESSGSGSGLGGQSEECHLFRVVEAGSARRATGGGSRGGAGATSDMLYEK